MKPYQHILIISALAIFTILFYKDGFGAVSFLLAAVYLSVIFIKEIRRERKNNET